MRVNPSLATVAVQLDTCTRHVRRSMEKVGCRPREIQQLMLTSQRMTHRRGRRAKRTGMRERHTKQVNQSEDPMEETSELIQKDRQLPSECTTDPQTEQIRAMTHSGDGNDEATSQQQAGGQKEGDAMEIRETIPEYTPVPEQAIPLGRKPQDDVTSMKNNAASRHKASNKAGITLKGTAAGTSQRNVKKNTEETRNSPKRLKKIRVEGTGEQPHERKRSKTRRSTQKNEQP